MHLFVKGPKEGIINLTQVSNKISGEFDLSIDEDKEYRSSTCENEMMLTNNGNNIEFESREHYLLYRLRVKDPSILLSSTYGILVGKEKEHSESSSSSIARRLRETHNTNVDNIGEESDYSKSKQIADVTVNEYLCPSHHLILRANTDILQSGKLTNIRVEYIEISSDDAKKLMSSKKLTKDFCGHYFADSEYKILYVKCTLAENGDIKTDSVEQVISALDRKANELENLELDQSADEIEKTL